MAVPLSATKESQFRNDGIHNREILSLLKGPITVTVTVGREPDIATWVLPKGLLERHSKLFTNSSTNVTFPDQEPAIFELFVKWLFLGSWESEYAPDSTYESLWILGQALQCEPLEDFAILQILHSYSTWQRSISPAGFMRAHNHTPIDSKLRQWALDQFIFDVCHGHFQSSKQTWNGIFQKFKSLEGILVQRLMSHGIEGIQNPCQQKHRYLLLPEHQTRYLPTQTLNLFGNLATNPPPTQTGNLFGHLETNPLPTQTGNLFASLGTKKRNRAGTECSSVTNTNNFDNASWQSAATNQDNDSISPDAGGGLFGNVATGVLGGSATPGTANGLITTSPVHGVFGNLQTATTHVQADPYPVFGGGLFGKVHNVQQFPGTRPPQSDNGRGFFGT